MPYLLSSLRLLLCLSPPLGLARAGVRLISAAEGQGQGQGQVEVGEGQGEGEHPRRNRSRVLRLRSLIRIRRRRRRIRRLIWTLRHGCPLVRMGAGVGVGGTPRRKMRSEQDRDRNRGLPSLLSQRCLTPRPDPGRERARVCRLL